ncbi:MAG TPA: hypothetical protein VMY05_08605 [Acidobacteriota bacterium]|nr:hypothetical protein [Acidobacteriota bacterium]
MVRRRHIRYAVILAIAIFAGMSGCGEKDVPFVIDADEVAAYVQQSPEAGELFRTGGLFPTEPYVVGHQDSATYRDRILSHKRTIDVGLVPLRLPDGSPRPEEDVYADYGLLGRLREAWATVTDEFSIETTRAFAAETLVDTSDREFVRYGFFLKLGSDAQDYVGWKLYGYNGLGSVNAPLYVSITAPSGDRDTSFTGNLNLYTNRSLTVSAAFGVRDYVKLEDIVQINNGGVLSVVTQWAGSVTSAKRDYPLIAADSQEGFRTQTLDQVQQSRDSYSGSVDTRNGSKARYGFLFFQSIHDDEFFPTRRWCVPYRLF